MEKETDTDRILRAIADVHENIADIRVTMATNDDLAKLRLEDLDPMKQDIKAIKTDIAELKAGSFSALEKEDLLARMKYVEVELGIESGK